LLWRRGREWVNIHQPLQERPFPLRAFESDRGWPARIRLCATSRTKRPAVPAYDLQVFFCGPHLIWRDPWKRSGDNASVLFGRGFVFVPAPAPPAPWSALQKGRVQPRAVLRNEPETDPASPCCVTPNRAPALIYPPAARRETTFSTKLSNRSCSRKATIHATTSPIMSPTPSAKCFLGADVRRAFGSICARPRVPTPCGGEKRRRRPVTVDMGPPSQLRAVAGAHLGPKKGGRDPAPRAGQGAGSTVDLNNHKRLE